MHAVTQTSTGKKTVYLYQQLAFLQESLCSFLSAVASWISMVSHVCTNKHKQKIFSSHLWHVDPLWEHEHFPVSSKENGQPSSMQTVLSYSWVCLHTHVFLNIYANESFRGRKQKTACLPSQFGQAVIEALLGHLIGLISSSQFTRCREKIDNWFIDKIMSNSATLGGDMPPFSWLLLDRLPVDLSHIPKRRRTRGSSFSFDPLL